MTEENRTELFSGVRVVELASWVFVPVAGALLADWGAEVTKVEHVERQRHDRSDEDRRSPCS